MQELKLRFKENAFIFTPLYRASIHDWTCKAFHEKCDNIGPTITLFTSQSGKRFGGFTRKKWDSVSEEKEDDKAFLFSIDQQKAFPVQNSKYAIFCKDDRGPSFGNLGKDL